MVNPDPADVPDTSEEELLTAFFNGYMSGITTVLAELLGASPETAYHIGRTMTGRAARDPAVRMAIADAIKGNSSGHFKMTIHNPNEE